MKLRLLPILPALALAAAAAPSWAQPVRVGPSYSVDSREVLTDARVRAEDLDPGSPEDARRLMQRMEVAADAVCRTGRAVTRDQRADAQDCRRRALARALASLRPPARAALAANAADPPRAGS